MRHLQTFRVAVCLLEVACVFAGAPGMAVAQDNDSRPPRQLATDDIPAHPVLSPRVGDAPSRPEAWPTNSPPPSGKKGVISSIRARPGEPLTEGPMSLDSPSGVVQTQYTTPAESAPAAPPNATFLEAAFVVARVGPEVILEADLLMPKALVFIEKASASLPPDKLRELRLQICKQVVGQHVETILIYVDACREIPEDKLPEIRKSLDQAFNDTQLPKMMEEEGASNSLEYERQLRARGSSLDRLRKTFFEQALAQEWLRKNTASNEEIPHADLIAWYQNHLEEYDIPARAKFEIITVKLGPTRTRSQAWEIVAGAGNEILGGRAFAEVAKTRSEGPTSSSGGAYDWTTKGSLALKKVNEAIFTLPVGELSAIIDDGNALHIVRVTEREEAGRTSFIDAQVAIRQTLMEQRRKTAVDEYLARLRARTPVWTIFDDPGGDSTSPEFTAGRPTAPATRR